MFILRTIHSDHTEQNHVLGDNYQVVRKSRSKEQFDHVHGLKWPNEEERPIDKELFGYVVNSEADKAYPLYNYNEYWIMTGEGKSFSRIK